VPPQNAEKLFLSDPILGRISLYEMNGHPDSSGIKTKTIGVLA
jgi:hypothetical protein